MKVMHVASEVMPYSKTGGLADVLAALPRAQARLGLDVTVVTPKYRAVDAARFGLARWLRKLPVQLGSETVEVGLYEGQPPGGKVRLYFVDHPPSFDRDGLYTTPGGTDFADNARRFTLLGRAARAIAAQMDGGSRWPDVLHGHDWQAGPALVEAVHGAPPPDGRARPHTVFTVHNLSYQGLFPDSILDQLGLPRALYHPDGFEFYERVSFLKAGLVLADRITTVSPRYAQEITTPEQGMGLDGLLRARQDRLTGILNGVDYDVWSPERDPQLAHSYSHDDVSGKRACKAALQRELGLPLRAETPLCGTISRFVEQKGFDLILEALPELLKDDVQYAVLGTGEPAVERALTELARKLPGKLAVRIGYDDPLAHRIEAGCDLYVMPSRYEPCGLNQMYSLRYGTVPIVRATGGLDDTVVDFDARTNSGTGFKLEPYSSAALLASWRRALHVYQSSPDAFSALLRRGMAQDFSWHGAARRYVDLYQRLK
jgi:starch synthase